MSRGAASFPRPVCSSNSSSHCRQAGWGSSVYLQTRDCEIAVCQCHVLAALVKGKPPQVLVDQYLDRARTDILLLMKGRDLNPRICARDSMDGRHHLEMDLVAWVGREFLGGCETRLHIGRQGWGEGRSSAFRSTEPVLLGCPSSQRPVGECHLKAESLCASEPTPSAVSHRSNTKWS